MGDLGYKKPIMTAILRLAPLHSLYIGLRCFAQGRGFSCLGVAVFAYLTLWRVPEQLFVPALYLEQASVYYKFAFEHSWIDAVLAPHQGYYSLWTNLVTLVAARYFPMEDAPYVVMAGGAMVGALLAALVFMPGSPFPTPMSKVLALWLMVLVPPSNDRFLLNYCHFYTCVAAVLVLLSDARSRSEALLQRRVLVFAVLSGPVVIFLAPVFLLAYASTRARERGIQLCIMACGALAQAAAYAYSQYYALNTLTYANGGSRFNGLFELDAFSFWLFNRSLVHPYGGWDMMVPIGWFLESMTGAHGLEYACALFFSLLGCGGFLILLYGERGALAAHRQLWLVLSFLCLSYGIFITGAVAGDSKASIITAAHRYFVAQSMLAGIAFALHSAASRQRKVRCIYALLIAWQLVAGWEMWRHYAQTLPPQISWAYQMMLWKRNPWHNIHIMPPGYIIRLEPQAP